MNSQKNISQLNNSSEDVSLKELILKFREWWKYLLSKWLVISVFGIIGGLLGLGYAYTKKPLYKATTTFVLEEDKSGGGLNALSGLASVAGLDFVSGGGIFQGDNILELYKSRSIIEKTLLTEVAHNGTKELLINCYIDFNNLRAVWSKNVKLENIQFTHNLNSNSSLRFTRLQDSIIGTIVNDIRKNYLNVMKPDKTLSIIQADIKASNEFFAKEFNTQLVKNVNEFYIQTKTKKSLNNIIILQQKVDSVQAVLNGAIYTSAKVTDATPNLNPTRQIQRTLPIQKSQVTAEVNKAVLTELIRNLELSKISLQKETPLIQVIDEPIFPLDKTGMGKLKGLILGGALFGFLSVIFIMIKKIIIEIVS
ncbi:hypothetical protein HDC92_003340 [Pedobacter sp. AK017]|uniref:Wzz/FepE/Etk N-terminal domain-containing protein n=1 Tax=Pedobacter sp. AK017 TaxID=2723073 RepID=UPI00161E1D84|nr:Wzz/FepE/Etk N-terminal domain-containing protein [Pedobacter sp. AK017]MBB5439644.1 hypothetical protein [Pedobacter sp. AK017]